MQGDKTLVKLVHLSVICITACVMGLVALFMVGLHSMGEMQEKQAQIKALMALHHRIGEFSVASDAFLVDRAAPAHLDAYRAEASSLKETLAVLAEDHPGAGRAMHHIDFLVGTLAAVYSQPPGPWEEDGLQPLADSPLLLPLRSQIIMSQVAGYGIALDTALQEVTSQRQAMIARDAKWIASGFAGAAALFGILCVTAFGLLYRRINGPMRALSGTIMRIEAGESGIRAPVEGRDEFADLARTFNQMLDQQGQMVATLAGALETRRALINSLPAHIALLDGEGKILDVNDQWRHFGIDNDYRDETLGVGRNYLTICRSATGDCAAQAQAAAQGLQSVLDGTRQAFALEYPCHSPDQPRWFRMMASRLFPYQEPGSHLGAVVMHVDITERKLAERELNRLAYEDSLTGLANRQGFLEGFGRHIEAQGWEPESIVILMDIKGQRNINDAHGYRIGDRLLMSIASRLESRLEAGTLVGRVSGDEFIVFLPRGVVPEDHHLAALFDTIFASPFVIDGLRLEASAHFGFTSLGSRRRSAETLLHETEIALRETRQEGIGDWTRYTPRMDKEAQERITLTRELRRALDEEQFELYYQPKVDLQSGEMIGCEALLRWLHPERGMQSPGHFIPVAEQSQLIAPIGNWVLLEACRHLREWQEAGLTVVRVSINVSVVQLKLGGFADKVRDAILACSIDPSSLTLEITENVFAEESETLHREIDALHGLGVRLSLDDFGTGYSSLLYLQQYPFDEIKVDMGFVQRLLEDPFSRRIVAMVIGISEVLGADAVAEGIETLAVRDALVEMGCRNGQGYHFSRPLDVDDFRWLLETGERLPLTPSSAIQ